MFRGFGGPKRPPPTRKVERTKVPFKRVSAKIQADDTQEVAECRIFLNDLKKKGVGCFANVSFDKGLKISMVIEHPRALYLRGEIIWCSPYSSGANIISAEQFKYRVGIKFNFSAPDEEEAIKKFLEELYTS